jgi:cytochrome c oxidase subunit IV
MTEQLHDQAHPNTSVYVKVALFLAVVTAVEVALSYVGFAFWITATSLIVLSIVKFVVVVGWFMHLKFDNPLLRLPFITGMVLAVSIYLVVLLNMLLHSTEG